MVYFSYELYYELLAPPISHQIKNKYNEISRTCGDKREYSFLWIPLKRIVRSNTHDGTLDLFGYYIGNQTTVLYWGGIISIWYHLRHQKRKILKTTCTFRDKRANSHLSYTIQIDLFKARASLRVRMWTRATAHSELLV